MGRRLPVAIPPSQDATVQFRSRGSAGRGKLGQDAPRRSGGKDGSTKTGPSASGISLALHEETWA